MKIRPAEMGDVAAIAMVRVDTWRTTYPGLIPQHVLDAMTYVDSEQNWRSILASKDQARYAYVAEMDNHIVGFAVGGVERGRLPTCDGELYALYLLKAYQRRGIGRRLLLAVAQRLREDDYQCMSVWVLAGNPARHFYQALGGTAVRSVQVEMGGVMVEEVCYLWESLAELVNRLLDEQTTSTD